MFAIKDTSNPNALINSPVISKTSNCNKITTK